MTKFSANLGFLWRDRPLPDAIRAAKRAGFDAVECHWPYDVSVTEMQTALKQTGLRMLGINTRRGDVAAGDNGLAALPHRVEEARSAIIEALEYAKAINADAVHVMAGVTSSPAARGTFIENLSFACAHAGERTILIEPLNPHDAPGYFLGNTQQAADIIAAVDQPRLKLMFDCYHVGRTDGDVCAKLTDLFPIIGHIQFAAVPDRGVPDHGEMNYAEVFAHLAKLGWDRPLGAEYKSDKPTDETLGWMRN